VIDALDLKDAREKLSSETFCPNSSPPPPDGGTASSNDVFLSRHSLVRIQPRGEFYRAMSAMLKAGLPLVASLEVQLDQRQRPSGRSSDAKLPVCATACATAAIWSTR
jgi:type II secretory pathway component PulF